MKSVNKGELEAKVKNMYQKVAQEPHGDFHFQMGRGLAEALGYPSNVLDQVASEAVDSFAGVGYHFDIADIQKGEKVLDLGSGSGMDAFVAALMVGEQGKVVGVDMTEAQLKKSDQLRASLKLDNISFRESYIESLPLEDGCFDVVISNGVINLSSDKEKVFQETCRVLKGGGRLAISDIVSEKKLPEGITCDASLWASCIGGAMQEDECRQTIEAAGMRLVSFRENPQYQFLSESAQWACEEFGVKSISLVAKKL